MKQTARILGYVFTGFTILAGLAWLNNVMVAIQWNPKDAPSKIYHGPISLLDWSAVDFSTVTTFVPFLGFLLIAVGFFSIAKAKRNTNVSEYFPFLFKPYNSVTVSLGLIGTVWGLIMIGYYEPEKIQMAQLILCLRTALYSTLIALIWVFIIVFPTRYFMQRWYRSVSGYKEIGDAGNIISLLQNLGSTTLNTTKELQKTSNQIQGLGESASETSAVLGEVTKALTTLNGKVGDIFTGLKEVSNQMHAECASWQKAAEALRKAAEEQQKLLEPLKSEIERQIRQRTEAEKRATNAEDKLSRVREALK